MKERDADFAFGVHDDEPATPVQQAATGNAEFRHYQQSLSSLGAMIDRVCVLVGLTCGLLTGFAQGDCESLMELFD